MKTKNNPNGSMTKNHLKKELTAFEGRLNKKFDKRFDIAEQVLRAEIQTSVSEAKEELKGFITEATDKILTRIDPFVKEVRDSHEERSILTNQISELRVRVDDHDEQLKQLKQR